MRTATKTYLTQILLFGVDELTYSPAASPASHSATQASEKARMTTAFSGRRCYGQFEKFSRSGSSLKTCLAYLLSSEEWFSSASSLTWKWKVTKSRRLLFQLALSRRRTSETGFGLLHTPTAVNVNGRSDEAWEKRACYRASIGRKTVPPGGLAEQIQLLPTIVKADGEKMSKRYAAGNLSLHGTLSLIPTLMPSDMEGGRTTKGKNRQSETGLRQMLAILPTPTMNGNRNRSGLSEKSGDGLETVLNTIGANTGLKLQPAFASWMMGYPEDWTLIPFLAPEVGDPKTKNKPSDDGGLKA